MESPLRPDHHVDEPSSDEIKRAKQIALGQLLERGLDVAESATPEQLVDLLEAVERFEAATARHGCDAFTNTLESSAPDDPDCVLPQPRADETLESYIVRVRRQAEILESR